MKGESMHSRFSNKSVKNKKHLKKYLEKWLPVVMVNIIFVFHKG